MLGSASGSLTNYPGHPPAAPGGLGSLVPDLVLGPRKPLDIGELQQPGRRGGPRRGVPTAHDWDGASFQCATSRRSTRALRSGRGAQAQGSVRACECDGERAYLAAPTRSTGHTGWPSLA